MNKTPFRPTPEHLIVAPVQHIMGKITDAESHMICDIRGWGRLQYMEKGEELQDKIGDFIADAINEKLDKDPI